MGTISTEDRASVRRAGHDPGRVAPPACVPRGLPGVTVAPRSSVELYPLGAPTFEPSEPDYGPPRTEQQLPHQPSRPTG